MKLEKKNKKIIIDLDDDEDEAMEFLVQTRGINGLSHVFQALIDSRKINVEEVKRKDVFKIFKKMTNEEKAAFLARGNNG